MSKKTLITAATAVIVAVVVILFGITMFHDSGVGLNTVTEKEACSDLSNKLKRVSVSPVSVKPVHLDVSEFLDLKDELPDIESSYPLTVEGHGAVNVEIFSSGEKAALSGTDAFLTEMAKQFNQERRQTSSGQIMSVSLRSIPSGTATEYIISGKYVPEAYTPSNELFGSIVESAGVAIRVAAGRVAGNVAGILLSNQASRILEEEYGEASFASVVQGTIDGKISMGYSNPYSSATGLNFLLTALYQADAGNMLGNDAVNVFRGFQEHVPLVSITTQQMTASAEKGIIDGMVGEYQTYVNDAALTRNYGFIPFGVRHDNPMYAVGSLNAGEEECLEAFLSLCAGSQDMATERGFNGLDSYVSSCPSFDGRAITQAQSIWKEEKGNGIPVVAEFVVDTSGSMSGEPLNQLRIAMANTIQYIRDDNYIGVLSFDDSVYELLPVGVFDLEQKTKYRGAIDMLNAGGKTAMYNAIMAGLDRVYAKTRELGGNAKPVVFVLTDGESNVGYRFEDARSIIQGLKIPVYTISYNYASDILSNVAAINEAALITGSSDDITYKLRNLFNAEM